MEDYIEREKVAELIDYYTVDYFEVESYFGLLKEDFMQLPSADVAPVVHGKWVNDIQCSNCGWYMEDYVTISPMMVFFDYCPHCGAKMDLVI